MEFSEWCYGSCSIALGQVVHDRFMSSSTTLSVALISGSIRVISERLLGANGQFRRTNAIVILSTYNCQYCDYFLFPFSLFWLFD
jgi:hypothetical protein